MESSEFEKINNDLKDLKEGFSKANQVLKGLEDIQSKFEGLAKTYEKLNEYLEKHKEIDEYLAKVKQLHSKLSEDINQAQENIKKRFTQLKEENELKLKTLTDSKLPKISEDINQVEENLEKRFTQFKEEHELKLKALKSQIADNISRRGVELTTQEPDNTKSVRNLPVLDSLPSDEEMNEFLYQLLKETQIFIDKKNKSEISRFFRENLDKLNDDRLPELLQNWANKAHNPENKQKCLKKIAMINSLRDGRFPESGH